MILSEILAENSQIQNPVLDLGNLGLNGTEPELQLIKEFYWLDTLILGGYWHKYDAEKVTWETQKNGRYDDFNTQTYEQRQNILIVSPDFVPSQLKHLNLIGYYSFQSKGYEVMHDISFLQNLTLLETLELQYYAVQDLSPLQNLPNLKVLSLGGLQRANYEAISDITTLELLEIVGHKEVQNIQFVQKLQNLHYLDLAHIDISDISLLLNLPSLRHLCMHVAHDSKLENIDALAIHTELTTFRISVQKDISLNFIGHFTKLKTLHISGNWYKEVRKYDFLSKLTKLEYLSMFYGGIEDLTPLRDLSKLCTLALSHNHIQDITPLVNLTSLEHLDLSFNKNIKDISILFGLKNLIRLYVRDCGLAELHLDETIFPNLQELSVSENNFVQFSIKNLLYLNGVSLCFDESLVLKNLPHLKGLDLKKINPSVPEEFILENLDNLEFLEIISTNIHLGDYDFLQDFPKLKKLKLPHIKSFEFLKHLPNKSLLEKLEVDKMIQNTQVGKEYLYELQGLKELRLNNCYLEDIDFVRNMPLLEKLLVSQNNIQHIQGVENLKKLKQISLWNNQIIDISPIANLENLEEVDASENQIQSIDFQGNCQKTRTLDISKNQIEKLILCDLPNLSSLTSHENCIKEIVLKNLLNLEIFNENDYSEDRVNTKMDSLVKIVIENVPLNTLSINCTKLTDFSFLRTICKTLVNLSLTKNNIADFSFFQHLPTFEELTELNISNNPVENVNFIKHFPKIEHIRMYGTKIKVLTVVDIPTIKSFSIDFWNYEGSKPMLEKIIINNSNAFVIDDTGREWMPYELAHVTFEADEHYYAQLKKDTKNLQQYTITPNSTVKLADLLQVEILNFEYPNSNDIDKYFEVDVAEIVQYNSKVKQLNFRSTKIKNMYLLADLPFLERLSIGHCCMDYFMLPFMPNLKSIYIAGIWDIGKFHIHISDNNAPLLESIRVDGANIGELKIENLKKIKNIHSESQAKLLVIQNCEVLEEMELELGYVGNVNIEKLPFLNKLSIKYNRLSLHFLRELTNLEDLRLDQCENFKGIENVKFLDKLKSLDCSTFFSSVKEEDKIQDISFLSELLAVEFLDFNGHKIEDIRPLSHLTKLKSLNLEANKIQDVSPLRDLVNLKYLCLDYNQITDISSLNKLINLQRFDLKRNLVHDISSLISLKKLYHLEINHNQITDFEPLKQMRNLNVLSSSGNRIATPPRWLVSFNHYRYSGMDINNLEELPYLQKIFSLMESGNDSFIELARQLAKLQGWKEEDIESYLKYAKYMNS